MRLRNLTKQLQSLLLDVVYVDNEFIIEWYLSYHWLKYHKQIFRLKSAFLSAVSKHFQEFVDIIVWNTNVSGNALPKFMPL